mgnify:CR=1 FL=1
MLQFVPELIHLYINSTINISVNVVTEKPSNTVFNLVANNTISFKPPLSILNNVRTDRTNISSVSKVMQNFRCPFGNRINNGLEYTLRFFSNKSTPLIVHCVDIKLLFLYREVSPIIRLIITLISTILIIFIACIGLIFFSDFVRGWKDVIAAQVAPTLDQVLTGQL